MADKKTEEDIRQTESFALNSEELGQLRKVYQRLLLKMNDKLGDFEQYGSHKLQQLLQYSREWLQETQELTQLEVDRVKYFLKRDLSDLAKASKHAGVEFQHWMGLDLEKSEHEFVENLLSLADKTQLEWLQIADELKHEGIYRTGEMTIPGQLQCMHCGQKIHLSKISHIPPCPKCHQLEFARLYL